jgi:hypothetical protein
MSYGSPYNTKSVKKTSYYQKAHSKYQNEIKNLFNDNGKQNGYFGKKEPNTEKARGEKRKYIIILFCTGQEGHHEELPFYLDNCHRVDNSFHGNTWISAAGKSSTTA